MKTAHALRSVLFIMSLLTLLTLSGCASFPTASSQPTLQATGTDGPLSTLFLTWQEDPTTTMTVQWLEDAPALPPVGPVQAQQPLTYDIPYLEGIAIDGDAADWGDHGFVESFLHSSVADRRPSANFDGALRLAWDNNGLIALVHVVDDQWVELDAEGDYSAADSVELFFSQAVGSSNRIQLVVSPGVDGKQEQLRYTVHDRRPEKSAGIDVEVARKPAAGSYTLEVRFPWRILGIEPSEGMVVASQLYINDKDGTSRAVRLAWHPAQDAWQNSSAAHAIRLARQTASPAPLQIRFADNADQNPTVELSAPVELAGQTVEVISAQGRRIATATLTAAPGQNASAGSFELPAPPSGLRWGNLTFRTPDGATRIAEAPVGDALRFPGPARLKFGRVGQKLDRTARATVKPFLESPYAVQRVHLTGLEPDTAYQFQVEGSDRIFSFRTAPATLDRPIVFAEGGDVGTDSSVVGPLHQLAASWNPLFGLLGGDLAYCNGKSYNAWLIYLQNWHQHMVTPDGHLIPMLVAMGNHEIRGGYSKRREDAPFFFSLFDGLFKDTAYNALDFGDYLSLIMLNTGHGSAIEGEQTQWLSRTLADRRHVAHVFPLYHVPAYPSARTVSQINEAIRANWVPLFEDSAVRVVFEHHDHAYKRTHPLIASVPTEGGIVYLGDGCWGRTPRKVDPTQPYIRTTASALHVIRTEISPAGRHFTAIDIDGKVIDRYPEE